MISPVFAEDAKDPAQAPFGDPYDEVVEDAEQVETDVEEAEDAAGSAIDGIDEDTAGKIDKAEEAVKDSEKVVDAANDTVAEAVNTANSAQQTVETAQQTVANAGTLTEREAALEIANAAVETAADAVTKAEQALTTANEAYDAAEQAVADAQKALEEITKAHNAAVGEARETFEQALAEAQQALDAAQEKLDDSAGKRAELESAAKDAADGLNVDGVLESEAAQKDLAVQTQDVQDKKEALDSLGTEEDARKRAEEAKEAKDKAQKELENFDTSKIDGKDEDKCKAEKEAAERESNKLSQTIAEIGGVLGQALTEQNANNSALTELQFTISEWEDTIVTLTGGQTIKNRELKAAIEEWNNGQGVLTETADKLFTIASEQFNGDKNAFMAALSKAMGEVPDAYDQLPGKRQEKVRLEELIAAKYEELGEARSNMLELMGKLNELNATLGQFETLNRLQHALNKATNNADKAQEDLKAFQGRLEEAQKAYSEAVANLSNTLKGEGDDKYSPEQYEQMMEDAGKLQDAIEKLNNLNEAIAEKEAAEEARRAAQYEHEHAQAGLKAAEEALAAAQERVNSAAAKDSQADLYALKASLEKAKAEFEAAKKAAEDAAENKEKADQAKAEADQNAADAAQRVQDAIDSMNDTGNAGDDIIADSGAVVAGATITIEDVAVPLASGPVSRGEFLDYLWRHEGSPEAGAPTFADVPAGHEFAPAIGWAQASGLVSGYGDGTFQPDELITVSAARAVLDSFARVFGGNAVDAAGLSSLSGEDDEAVLNCDEVLAEFFGEENAPAQGDEAA
ncbi:MAG: hypothetical protein HFF24_07035 [Oscillospiraceae bacterium]|nr:hypothetical protein [Oscillospiraceae bacterium]